jgi:hypothetical protein
LYKQANNETNVKWFKRSHWNGNKHVITLWYLTSEHVVKFISLLNPQHSQWWQGTNNHIQGSSSHV